MSNLTFGIIKPDAVRAGNQGKIISRILGEGFKIRGMKLIHQTRKQADGFYAVHAGKGFFDELCEFMSSGPCVVLALEKENPSINHVIDLSAGHFMYETLANTKGKCRSGVERTDGSDQPGRSSTGHVAKGFCSVDRRKRGSRF